MHNSEEGTDLYAQDVDELSVEELDDATALATAATLATGSTFSCPGPATVATGGTLSSFGG